RPCPALSVRHPRNPPFVPSSLEVQDGLGPMRCLQRFLRFLQDAAEPCTDIESVGHTRLLFKHKAEERGAAALRRLSLRLRTPRPFAGGPGGPPHAQGLPSARP